MNNWAYFLFFATIIIPDVSLSNLCTVYGDWPSNSLVYLKISRIFFLDFVPDWTDIPAGLLITTKLSLFSIKKFELDFNSILVGLYLKTFLVTLGEKFIL